MLTACRALEHNADGELVWKLVVVSTARQQGKSWLERMACDWRMGQADRWDEEQAILHVAHKLTAAQEVWRPAARFYDAAGESVRWANGEQAIELREAGSRWLIQAANEGAGVAFSLSMALIDEGWRVDRGVYDNAIEPTMAESESPQTWLVSTAGTADSDLMQHYRKQAIAQVEDPRDALIIEYSAPPGDETDIDDPAVWEAASAHWDERRRAWMERKRENAGERAFRQQALNQWVPSLTPPLIPPGTYERAATRTGAPGPPLVIGADIGENHDRGVIVVLGSGTAELIADEGGADWVPGRVAELAERHSAAAVGIDGTGPARSMITPLRKVLGDRLIVCRAGDMAASSGMVLDMLTGRGLGLRDHEVFSRAVRTARKRRAAGSWVWDRGDDGLVLVALTAAVHAEINAPEPEEDEEPMIYA
jgi:hypothetical protein